MSLATNVTNLATRIATEVKALRTLINGNASDLSALDTAATNNLVAAINEVNASVASASGINDATTSTTSSWSSQKTTDEIGTASTADRARANHTGTQSADTVVDGTTNHVFTAADDTKLGGIATGATANDTDANLKARANHTGTQSADTLTDGTTNKAFLATERTKLTGIATSATANSSDATLLARANHTGTQAAATISDFQATVDARISTVLDIAGAPGTLDTLNELAAALGDDPNYAATTATALGLRVRVDASQSLNGTQQTQGRDNIAAAAASDLSTLSTNVGSTTTDFVATFEAGLV
jgi:hypothetical protein